MVECFLAKEEVAGSNPVCRSRFTDYISNDTFLLQMENIKKSTIDAYDKNAKKLAKRFIAIGSRSPDVKEGFSYFPSRFHRRLKILEIGCGNGRDAAEILKYTRHYLGIDISSGMIAVAKKYLPKAKFKKKDMLTFKFPVDVDIIFAFASLVHLNKGEIKFIIRKAHSALSLGAIFYISLKEGDYRSEIKENEYGRRIFYYYKPEDINRLSKGFFKVKKLTKKKVEGINWFDIILQKD